MASWTYRCEYTRCGKESCRRCPHGPYWYGYRKLGGKMHKKYFGKKDPRELNQEQEKKLDPRADIFSSSKATGSLARSILGVTKHAGKEECKKAYRKIAMELHPDRGGKHHEMQLVNAAWSFLDKSGEWI